MTSNSSVVGSDSKFQKVLLPTLKEDPGPKGTVLYSCRPHTERFLQSPSDRLLTVPMLIAPIATAPTLPILGLNLMTVLTIALPAEDMTAAVDLEKVGRVTGIKNTPVVKLLSVTPTP